MSEKILTIKTAGEAAAANVEPPAVLENIPIYNDFFTHPELYQRIHFHLVAVRPTAGAHGGGFLHAEPGLYVPGPLGFGMVSLPRLVSPTAKVEAYGANTGSTDYFPIGVHQYSSCKDTRLPTWDARAFVISKSGRRNTEGIKLTVLDGNDELFTFKASASDFPAVDEDYKEFVHVLKESASTKGVELVYKIRVTECRDRISEKHVLARWLDNTEDISYSEEVIENWTKMDKALLQCWRQKGSGSNSKAVLWFIGRNDCFMHPHVAKTLFTDQGYDLYVLNYSCDGMCRKRGWIDDPHYNSHNRTGSFDLYIPQIEKAMGIMKSHKDYDSVVGYAHSTGAPVLINYLMEKGDDFFDGFIFNSPFLDWSFADMGLLGDLAELFVEHTDILTFLSPFHDNNSKIGVAPTPEALKNTPVKYMGEEIVLSAWSAKLWSLYYFDFRCRPLYKVPLTPGFSKGVTDVHNKLLKYREEKKFVTLKPLVCITSESDDVLSAKETLDRVDILGPARHKIELRYNAHDVFLSEDHRDVNMAVEMVGAWMKTRL